MTTTCSTLAGALHEHAQKTPEKRCLVFEGATWTYAAVRARAEAFARALVDWGLKPGERVALYIENSPEFIFCYFGTHLAGGTVVLVNNQYKQVELRHILGDSGARVCVTGGAQMAELARVRGDMPALALILTLGEELDALVNYVPSATPLRHPNPDDVAVLAYTSGTTGPSKGALLLHRNTLSNARSVTEAWQWTAEDHLLHMLPLFHAHGLMVGIHGTILAGASCELHRQFNARIALDRLRSGEFTLFFGVPTLYTRLIAEAAESGRRPPALRLYVSGSAALAPQTLTDFERLSGQRILERYGMTETIMNLTNPCAGERRPGTVGQPFPRQEARVVDRVSRLPLGPEEIGEIEVRGPHVFAGYLNQPDATAESFSRDGWFKTGDLGKVSADGYYTITGRTKDLIISGGYNIYPREVEEALLSCPGVAEAAVFGQSDPEFGECVCAAIVRTDLTLTAEAVVEHCRAVLAGYKKPRHLFFVEALPRNAMGKVQKHILAETIARPIPPVSRKG